jgi:hypothetical protein
MRTFLISALLRVINKQENGQDISMHWEMSNAYKCEGGLSIGRRITLKWIFKEVGVMV